MNYLSLRNVSIALLFTSLAAACDKEPQIPRNISAQPVNQTTHAAIGLTNKTSRLDDFARTDFARTDFGSPDKKSTSCAKPRINTDHTYAYRLDDNRRSVYIDIDRVDKKPSVGLGMTYILGSDQALNRYQHRCGSARKWQGVTGSVDALIRPR